MNMINGKLELHGLTYYIFIGWEYLRLDIRRYEKLCYILKYNGGLVTIINITMKEVPTLFLRTLGHDLENWIIQAIFAHSREIMSRQFHIVLGSVLKLESITSRK